MSAAFEFDPHPLALPLLQGLGLDRTLAFGPQDAVGCRRFLAEAQALARALPEGLHAVNLCEDRYRFLLAFCAVALRGQITLLPPSRAPQVIDDVLARYPGSYSLGEGALDPAPPRYHRLPPTEAAPEADIDAPCIPAGQVVAIGFTSGSSGQPKANPKTWGSFAASTALNAALLRERAGDGAQVVATVPPQHMYGMETSVLLPLLGGVAVHTGRPFFPAEIAAALAQAQAPRVLVSTPVHLRALLESGLDLPPLALVLSATAPLPAELAQAIEARYACEVRELFGSTETCVIGHRRTASEMDWQRYAGVRLQPQPDGTEVDADWFVQPVLLQDLIEPFDGGFRLRGRSSDLLEIAGKRASLGDLTRRLLAVPGVEDGVVFQSEDADAGGVRRLCALVVAPDLDEAAILAALRAAVDPVFLPRPLRRVAALPRNETGKLPRAALLALLGETG
jgi:acyl-coenzyme A synthetase/AMP-(fatty) acid ligase